MKKKKVVKPKKVPLGRNGIKPIVSPDICGKCGAEYYDILGIGSCGKCFYGHNQ